MYKYVCELPQEVQNEIRRDALAILSEIDTSDPIDEIIEVVMNEKIINIIGHEYGLLDADKYGKYVFK